MSQSAFVRGFIDDLMMALVLPLFFAMSQSAFVRGFIDDTAIQLSVAAAPVVSIRVRARLHR